MNDVDITKINRPGERLLGAVAFALLFLTWTFDSTFAPAWYWLYQDLAARELDGAWVEDGADCASPSMIIGTTPLKNVPETALHLPRLRRDFFVAYNHPWGLRRGGDFFAVLSHDLLIGRRYAHFDVAKKGDELTFSGIEQAGDSRHTHISKQKSEWQLSLPRYAALFDQGMHFKRCT